MVVFNLPEELQEKTLAAAAVRGLLLTLYKDIFEVRFSYSHQLKLNLL